VSIKAISAGGTFTIDADNQFRVWVSCQGIKAINSDFVPIFEPGTELWDGTYRECKIVSGSHIVFYAEPYTPLYSAILIDVSSLPVGTVLRVTTNFVASSHRFAEVDALIADLPPENNPVEGYTGYNVPDVTAPTPTGAPFTYDMTIVNASANTVIWLNGTPYNNVISVEIVTP